MIDTFKTWLQTVRDENATLLRLQIVLNISQRLRIDNNDNKFHLYPAIQV